MKNKETLTIEQLESIKRILKEWKETSVSYKSSVTQYNINFNKLKIEKRYKQYQDIKSYYDEIEKNQQTQLSLLSHTRELLDQILSL